MTGYIRGDIRTAEQKRWSDYYLTRDLEQAGPALHLLTPEFVSGTNRLVSQLDSTVVDAVLPAYHPVDARSKREQQVNRKQYSKAKAYYGSTYIMTRRQLTCAVLIFVGSVLILSSLISIAAVHAIK
jgi:hypothetical protein